MYLAPERGGVIPGGARKGAGWRRGLEGEARRVPGCGGGGGGGSGSAGRGMPGLAPEGRGVAPRARVGASAIVSIIAGDG